MALGAGDIRKHAGSFKTREVHVPAWRNESGDDVVLVRGMTLRELEMSQKPDDVDKGEATARMLTRVILDESNGRVFADEDRSMIAELQSGDTNRLVEAMNDLSGLTEKSRQDAEGNSEPTPTGSSDSGSPENSA